LLHTHALHLVLHRAETEWRGRLPRFRTGSSGTETLQAGQHLLSFVIEFDSAFGRMVDDLAGLVMLDIVGVGPVR
jgi:hypothetical protein